MHTLKLDNIFRKGTITDQEAIELATNPEDVLTRTLQTEEEIEQEMVDDQKLLEKLDLMPLTERQGTPVKLDLPDLGKPPSQYTEEDWERSRQRARARYAESQKKWDEEAAKKQAFAEKVDHN